MASVYTATATATGGGRGGHVTSSDSVLNLDLAVPKEMGGPGGEKSNPEQLFAAGYAACFHGALQMIASKQKVKLEGSSVTAAVGIGPNGSGGFGLEVALQVALPGVDQATGEALVATAHQVCPYSNATRGNIEVTLVVSTEAATV
jgi:lipoyl-dependent peroxiredoxin